MKKILFLLAFVIAGAGFVQPTFAASEEPAATATEPMKAKPAKHKATRHHHERHSSVAKARKAV